jgi:hypothetical protein
MLEGLAVLALELEYKTLASALRSVPAYAGGVSLLLASSFLSYRVCSSADWPFLIADSDAILRK